MSYRVGRGCQQNRHWAETLEEAWEIARVMAEVQCVADQLDLEFAKETYGEDPFDEACGICPWGDDRKRWPQIEVAE